jgi:hypothetical protein
LKILENGTQKVKEEATTKKKSDYAFGPAVQLLIL